MVNVTGARHEVAADEMFFSTTDEKGVIEESNSVFVRLSRFGVDELVGAPHNLIRHPEMPGAAFYAMWATLKAGKPFAAYVRNLAKDGSEYDVFATVTPMPGGGYLSVRTRPMVQTLFDAACELYSKIHLVEELMRTAGHSRHQTAVEGASALGEALGELGFDSYADFQALALPAEIAARTSASQLSELIDLEALDGDALTIAQEVPPIEESLAEWSEALSKIDDLSSLLHKAGRTLRREVDAAGTFVAEINSSHGDVNLSEDVIMPLEVWSHMRTAVTRRLEKLFTALGDFDTLTTELKQTACLCRLQIEMTTRFVVELSQQGGAFHAQAVALARLAESVAWLLSTAEKDGEAYVRSRAAIADNIAQVASLMAIPQQLMEGWRADYGSADNSGIPPELVQKVSSSVTRGEEALSQLGELVDLVENTKPTIDIAALLARVEIVRGAAENLQEDSDQHVSAAHANPGHLRRRPDATEEHDAGAQPGEADDSTSKSADADTAATVKPADSTDSEAPEGADNN